MLVMTHPKIKTNIILQHPIRSPLYLQNVMVNNGAAQHFLNNKHTI